jgi:hypothetical protein
MPLEAAGQLGVALVRWNGWLLGWPWSLAPLVMLLLFGVAWREVPLLLPILALAALTFLFAGAATAVAGPVLLLPATPFAAVASARLLRDLRPRLGGWAAAGLVGSMLAAAGGFWRLAVVHETGEIALRAADFSNSARSQRVAKGVILFSPGVFDFVPPSLSIQDALLYVSDGERSGFARAWFAGRPAYRYILVSGHGQLVSAE